MKSAPQSLACAALKSNHLTESDGTVTDASGPRCDLEQGHDFVAIPDSSAVPPPELEYVLFFINLILGHPIEVVAREIGMARQRFVNWLTQARISAGKCETSGTVVAKIT